jgi:hypothetical protein
VWGVRKAGVVVVVVALGWVASGMGWVNVAVVGEGGWGVGLGYDGGVFAGSEL